MIMGLEFVGERLREIRLKKRIKQTELAKMLNVSQGQVSRYENYDDQPSYTIVKLMAEILGTTSEYLYGETDIMAREDDTGSGYSDTHKPKSNAEIVTGGFKVLPVYGSASAGKGADPLSEPIGWMPAAPGVRGDMWITIRGDSMEPRILDGDLVLVDKKAPYKSEDIVVVILDGEIYCKFIYLDNGSPTLYSQNPKYPPITPKNGIQFEIIGKVVGFFGQP